MAGSEPTLTFRESDHTYWVGDPEEGTRLFSATQIGAEAGLVDTRFFSPAAAERGTFIHSATEYLDREDVELQEDDLDEAIVPYIVAYKKFTEECHPQWEGIEEQMCDPQLGIAGTIDRWGYINPTGKKKIRVVLDIKSGASAPYHAVQLACYQHLITRKLLLMGNAHQHNSSKPLVERYCLYITKRGTYKLTKFSDVQDIAVFMAARTLVMWKNEHKLIGKTK